MGSTGECLLHQVLREAIGLKNTLDGVTDPVGPVMHTSQHPCDGSSVVV